MSRDENPKTRSPQLADPQSRGKSGFPPTSVAHRVFISYSMKDQSTADSICTQIEAAGIRCWIAPRDILPGAGYAEAIITAIETAHCMALVLSSNANRSHHVQREVERAVAKGVRIVPVRIEDTEMSKSLEYFLSTPHWVDAVSQPLKTAVAQLIESLRHSLPDAEPARKYDADPTWGGALWNQSAQSGEPKQDKDAGNRRRSWERLTLRY